MTTVAATTAAAAAAMTRLSDLWQQCFPCCRSNKETEDEDDTKLCQITLNLNCCANHNNIHTVTTDGIPKSDEEESEADEEEEEEDRDAGIVMHLYQRHCSTESARRRRSN